MSVEAERCQPISKKPRERRCEIDAHYEDPARTVNPFGQLNRTTSLQTRSQYAQTLDISLQAVLHLIGDTAFFLCRSFQHCVRHDVVDEVLAQVGREIRETFVAESLNGAHDCRCIDFVTLRHLTRRQEESLFVVIKNFSDQTTSTATQRRLGEAHFKRGKGRLGAVTATTVERVSRSHILLLRVWT